MYDRRLNGKVLSFGHAGILYKNSFVMYDRKTESLWVHVTGKAKTGPLAGQKLNFMPSTMATWEEWKQAYPHTLVLPGHRRGGFMGTYRGKYLNWGLGLAVNIGFEAKLYPFRRLKKSQVVNDMFRGTELVIAFYPSTSTATAWKRRLGERLLTFAAADQTDAFGHFLLQDNETGSLWSGMTGQSVLGPLKGQQLEQLAHHPLLNKRFHGFYPGAKVFE